MTDDTDIIEIDRETLAEFFHQRYVILQGFYPEEEFAEGVVATDDDTVGSYDEEIGYANGNIVAELDVLRDFGMWFDVDPEEMAREYADEHGHDTFEKPPFEE